MMGDIVWGWQPALYLFLGGMGAGAFLTMGTLFFRRKNINRLYLAAIATAALASIAIGLLLLLSELINPLRGLMMWQSFSHFTSWMTIGAWLAFCSMVAFAICAILLVGPKGRWARDVASRPVRVDGILRVVIVVGMVLAFGVAVYTGMLLMEAPGVPFWNTPLLPCLFTVSAIDTGVALVELMGLCHWRDGALRSSDSGFLGRVTIGLIVIESVLVVALMFSSLQNSDSASYVSAHLLLNGSYTAAFWILFVGIGLVVPAFAAFRALLRSKAAPDATSNGADGSAEDGDLLQVPGDPSRSDARQEGRPEPSRPLRSEPSGSILVSAWGVLIGGCTLRFLILLVGVHGELVASTLSLLQL